MNNMPFHLPETAVKCENCFSNDFLFHREASEIAIKIKEIIFNFDMNQSSHCPVYNNNVIGVLGRRGTGKTSLMSSVSSTFISNPDSAPFGNDSNISIFPLYDEIIDPKVLPNYISITDLVLSALFNDFKKYISNITEKSLEPKEEALGEIYDLFDEIGRELQFLSLKERKEIMPASSDLFEIAALTRIRKNIEILVDKLLKIKCNNNHAHSAFLLLIDDFDLDFSNCYQMTLNIISMLNIKGIIFLVAIDEDVFKREIVREIIKKYFDYGSASPYLFQDNVIRNRNILRMQNAGLSQPSYNSLILDAERYFDQLYNKFIPMDFRFRTRGHNLQEAGGEEFRNKFNEFCGWMFGFKPDWTIRKRNESKKYSDKFFDLLFDAFSTGNDLRLRNQGINRIFSLLEKKKDKDSDMLEIFEEFAVVFESFSKNAPEKSRFVWKVINDVCSVYFYDNEKKQSFFETNFHNLSIELDNKINTKQDFKLYSAFNKFFNEHPAACAAYLIMVDLIPQNSKTPQSILDDYADILQNFTKLKLEILNNDKDDNSVGNKYLKLGNDYILDADNLSKSLFECSRETVIKRIENVINLGNKNNKKDIDSLISLINSYSKNMSIYETNIQPFIDEIQESIRNNKWRGKDNNKEDSIEQVINALKMIKRRL